MAIRIFVTGGTFDKSYNELTGELYFKDTHLLEMLKLGRCKADFQIRTLMMTDSISMTEEDRKIIPYNCQKAEEDRIVLTGAMVPYTFVQTFPHEVNIAKNGKYFEADRVQKDKKTGKFVDTS